MTTCQHEFDEPQCVYGCGTFITIEDGGYCPVCKDHSNNSVECIKCGESKEWYDPFDPNYIPERRMKSTPTKPTAVKIAAILTKQIPTPYVSKDGTVMKTKADVTNHILKLLGV